MKIFLITMIFFILFSIVIAKDIDHLFSFPIEVVRVVDGDTIDANIDLGFNITLKKERIRILGCDAYEKSVPTSGTLATKATKNFLNTTNTLTLKSLGERDSFGRILGDIYSLEKDMLLHKYLIDNKHVTGRFENTAIEILKK